MLTMCLSKGLSFPVTLIMFHCVYIYFLATKEEVHVKFQRKKIAKTQFCHWNFAVDLLLFQVIPEFQDLIISPHLKAAAY